MAWWHIRIMSQRIIFAMVGGAIIMNGLMLIRPNEPIGIYALSVVNVVGGIWMVWKARFW